MIHDKWEELLIMCKFHLFLSISIYLVVLCICCKRTIFSKVMSEYVVVPIGPRHFSESSWSLSRRLLLRVAPLLTDARSSPLLESPRISAMVWRISMLLSSSGVGDAWARMTKYPSMWWQTIIDIPQDRRRPLTRWSVRALQISNGFASTGCYPKLKPPEASRTEAGCKSHICAHILQTRKSIYLMPAIRISSNCEITEFQIQPEWD